MGRVAAAVLVLAFLCMLLGPLLLPSVPRRPRQPELADPWASLAERKRRWRADEMREWDLQYLAAEGSDTARGILSRELGHRGPGPHPPWRIERDGRVRIVVPTTPAVVLDRGARRPAPPPLPPVVHVHRETW